MQISKGKPLTLAGCAFGIIALWSPFFTGWSQEKVEITNNRYDPVPVTLQVPSGGSQFLATHGDTLLVEEKADYGPLKERSRYETISFAGGIASGVTILELKGHWAKLSHHDGGSKGPLWVNISQIYWVK